MGRYFPLYLRDCRTSDEDGPPRLHATDIEKYLSVAAVPGNGDRSFGLDMPMGLAAIPEEEEDDDDDDEEGTGGNDVGLEGNEAGADGNEVPLRQCYSLEGASKD